MNAEEHEQPYSDVVLTISARNIKDVDTDSFSDPFCIVSEFRLGPKKGRSWIEIGRTEVINNCLKPEWATKIRVLYFFEEQQKLKFEVYDKGPGNDKRLIGVATLMLPEIIGSTHNRKTTKLYDENHKNYGTLTVSGEEMSKGRQESIYFLCSATKLDKKDFLGKCDPFLKISRLNTDQTNQLAYRTRYHEQNLNPKWKPFEIHIDQLCYGDKDREFLVECYDWDKDGDHDLVGECRTTVNRLLKKIDTTLPLINKKKSKKNKKYVNSGELHFHKVHCWMDYTFLDFITSGTELEFIVAIDFTKSNLPIENVASLHRFENGCTSQYEIAIRAIADICQHYNSSHIFNAYGFGARLPGDERVNFHFPLDLNRNSAECLGINGLLTAYKDVLRKVNMAGPTEFAPTLRHAARHAASLPSNGCKYCVLLIITDGVIDDMSNSKEEIIKASSLPLSIIIVGVGYNSFDEMKVLDSDRQMLHFNGKYAKRDIVQFVQLRDFLPPHRVLTDEDLTEAKYALAKEVLHEVPEQLTSYMKSRGIFPDQVLAAKAENRRNSSDSQSKHASSIRQLPAAPCTDDARQMRVGVTKSSF